MKSRSQRTRAVLQALRQLAQFLLQAGSIVRKEISIGLISLACIACTSALPEPKPARQPRSEYLPVPYPPPAGFAEVVPPTPNKRALWIDGHWAWRGRTYVWQRGGWVEPAAGSRFAHWRVKYTKDGVLLFADEAWYDANLRPMPSPKKLVPAYSPPNELTPEAQHGF